MANKQTEAQLFTVRAPCGGYVGTYRALTAQRAIQRAKDALATTAAIFRRSQPMPSVVGFKASVEPPDAW